MQIHHDPDEYETLIDQRTCAYHQAHPGVVFAGCACSFGVTYHRRPYLEIVKIRTARLRRHEDDILAQAEAIKARRAAVAP